MIIGYLLGEKNHLSVYKKGNTDEGTNKKDTHKIRAIRKQGRREGNLVSI